jgi:hypothetical protein
MSHSVTSGIDGSDLEQPLTVTCESEMQNSLDGLPEHLSCTGLYADMKKKTLAKGVQEFSPANWLWSDGADKTRWIRLPGKEKIDASNPDSWVFPVGTQAWKEFRFDGKRIETRIFQKVDDTQWIKGTFVWNDKETEALRDKGGHDMTVSGNPYYLPSNLDCDECHGGRKEKLLGFEQISLGVSGDHESALTLQDLVDDNRLKGFDGPTNYTIADDGSGVASKVLGALHINCGVSCHNGNPNSKGYSRGMRLTLEPGELDGRDPNDSQVIKTTVNQDAATLRWSGQKRIVPGKPDESLLYNLISQRGNKQQQMPPLGTYFTDDDFVQNVRTWIEHMPASE